MLVTETPGKFKSTKHAFHQHCTIVPLSFLLGSLFKAFRIRERDVN